MGLPQGRAGLLVVALLVGLMFVPARASAEWQIKPFLGVTVDAATTFTLGADVGHSRKAVGVSGMLIGEVVGVEGDIGHTPGFFRHRRRARPQQRRDDDHRQCRGGHAAAFDEVHPSAVLVGGAGTMRIKIEDFAEVLGGDNLPTVDFGGGVTGFLTNRVGVSWDVRYFRSVGGQTVAGVSIGPEQLSFWRANMALAIRF